MAYEIDHNYPFEYDNFGIPLFPDGMKEDGNLYLLPNGKYLPRGNYRTSDGGHIIYEPPQLSPYTEMLAQFNG